MLDSANVSRNSKNDSSQRSLDYSEMTRDKISI
jgi:hypothetical protein